jgi:cytochrome c oxidase subunit 3
MTKETASLSWPAGADSESAARDDVVQLGVWMFLATVVMLFAAFTSAYIVRRSAADWAPIALPWMLWVSTAALGASSIALERGRIAGRKNQAAPARRGFAAAAGLGLLFLLGQVAMWRALVAQGVYLPSNPYGSFFYVLTATHGVHVVAGLVLLLYTLARIGGGRVRLDRGAASRLIAASATFWHFLAALWVYVVALVSLF